MLKKPVKEPKKAMQKDEMMKAIENSDKSIGEIMAFVTENLKLMTKSRVES